MAAKPKTPTGGWNGQDLTDLDYTDGLDIPTGTRHAVTSTIPGWRWIAFCTNPNHGAHSHGSPFCDIAAYSTYRGVLSDEQPPTPWTKVGEPKFFDFW